MTSTIVPALAAEAPASSWVGNARVVSDYLFRGLSQTNRKSAGQAGVEFDHANGWYLGGWASNISWLFDASTTAAPVSSGVELDLYGGDRGSFGGDWNYDAGVYRYQYPGSCPAGFTRPNTTEVYAPLAWQSLSLKYSYALINPFGYATVSTVAVWICPGTSHWRPAGSSMRTSATSRWKTCLAPRTATGGSA